MGPAQPHGIDFSQIMDMLRRNMLRKKMQRTVNAADETLGLEQSAQPDRSDMIRQRLMQLAGPHQPEQPQQSIAARRQQLAQAGMSQEEAMQQMASEGLVSPRMARMFAGMGGAIDSATEDF